MRRVLVTGGGAGIGRAIARAFAQNGDAVTIAGRTFAPLQETAAGYGMTVRLADVTVEAQVGALFDAPFDVVIANAGGGGAGKLAQTSLDAWHDVIALNLTSTFLTFRAALQNLPQGARLIAIASTASLQGNAAAPAYTAAKHGVLGLVRSVAQDIARHGGTCNAICPGFTDTALAQKAIAGLMARFDLPPAAAAAKLAKENPQGRLIDPAEVAAAALYLAAAEGVNGHALTLSGGEI
jgi:NAD(P)-dependent dehydrogenase (short-subunit alcohol dehydrogenase family)